MVILATVAVVAAVLYVIVVVGVIIAPIFMMVIIATLVVSGAGSLFNFFSSDISVCYLYQFADGCGPLVV